MQGKIEINGQEMEFSCNGWTPFLFKEQFGEDIFKGISSMKDGDLDIVFLSRLAWVMRKQAEPSTPSIKDWLESMDMMDIVSKANEIVALWAKSMKTNSKSKKK